VNGDMIESKERSAPISDIEPDDFVRFLEYAYRRDYTSPSWIHDPSAMNDDHTPIAADVSTKPGGIGNASVGVFGGVGFGGGGPGGGTVGMPPADIEALRAQKQRVRHVRQKPDIKTDTMSSLRSQFQMRDYLGDPAPDADILKDFEPKPNSEADQDFTPVFLAHVRLYTFADMRLIYPLKSLALHKLQQTLIVFRLFDQRVGDIIKLARYAYDHEPDRSAEGVVNELRQLVVEYMAYQVQIVGKHQEFKALLEEGGEFVTDFWSVVSKYLLKA
jgi:hypothetical protein